MGANKEFYQPVLDVREVVAALREAPDIFIVDGGSGPGALVLRDMVLPPQAQPPTPQTNSDVNAG